MKYVIKNCDNYTEFDKDWTCRSTIQNRKGCYVCQDCTDCTMKQIVEKCKKEITAYRNTLLPNDGTNTLHFGRQSLAYDILKLLDIQEVK